MLSGIRTAVLRHAKKDPERYPFRIHDVLCSRRYSSASQISASVSPAADAAVFT